VLLLLSLVRVCSSLLEKPFVGNRQKIAFRTGGAAFAKVEEGFFSSNNKTRMKSPLRSKWIEESFQKDLGAARRNQCTLAASITTKAASVVVVVVV
jgi:hypothetical protein